MLLLVFLHVVPMLALALACWRACWHGTARLSTGSVVPGPRDQHAGTNRHGTDLLPCLAVPCPVVPCQCRAVPCGPVGHLYPADVYYSILLAVFHLLVLAILAHYSARRSTTAHQNPMVDRCGPGAMGIMTPCLFFLFSPLIQCQADPDRSILLAVFRLGGRPVPGDHDIALFFSFNNTMAHTATHVTRIMCGVAFMLLPPS
jgi:hypothetical protein